MTSSSVSIFSPLRMLNPTNGCSRIFANSSLVSLPLFWSTASGTTTLPMSCTRHPRSRRPHALSSSGEYFIRFAIIEQPGVVDGHPRLRRQLGDQAAVIRRESVADLVVGQEQDTDRLAPQRDGDAQHRPWIERAVLPVLDLHRPHVRLGGCHDLIADLSALPEG